MANLLPNEHIVDLANFDNGSANEIFVAELKKVLANIADANTDPEAKREIVLQFTFWPDPDRRSGKVSITPKCKLAPQVGAATTLYFGKVNGDLVAVESDPTQGGLFDAQKQTPPRLREIGGGKPSEED